MHQPSFGPRHHPRRAALAQPDPKARQAALERVADLAALAPSVHDTRPWRIELRADGLAIRADRCRQLVALDPAGRELTHSLGAALFNARVALATRGFDVDVARLPDAHDPDLLATVRLMDGVRDPALAALAPAIPHRRTGRGRFDDVRLPDDVMRRLTHAAAAEETLLVPVRTHSHLALLARLTQQAGAIQDADPAFRAELRRCTTRRRPDGDGVPATVVPHADARRHDELPVRDFATQGAGGPDPATLPGTRQTLLLLVTHHDDQHAWLRCGEAMQRIRLELTLLGWVASPLTEALEVPLTRTQLRSALTWYAHPQQLLRIGRAATAPPTPPGTRSRPEHSPPR